MGKERDGSDERVDGGEIVGFLQKGDLHTETFTQTRLHTGSFTHRSVYGALKLLHRAAFTHRSFYTKKPLHREDFTHTEAFAQGNFYTGKLLHTEAFKHISFLH